MGGPGCSGCSANNGNGNGTTPRRSFMGGARRPTSSVVVQDLLVQEVVVASKVHDTAFETRVLAEIEGPMLEDIVIHAEGRDMAATFEYRVLIQQRMNNGQWLPTSGITAADLPLGLQSGEGYVVGSAFSDRTRLGYRCRLVLQFHTKSTGGGAPGDSGELSIAVAKRFFT